MKVRDSRVNLPMLGMSLILVGQFADAMGSGVQFVLTAQMAQVARGMGLFLLVTAVIQARLSRSYQRPSLGGLGLVFSLYTTWLLFAIILHAGPAPWAILAFPLAFALVAASRGSQRGNPALWGAFTAYAAVTYGWHVVNQGVRGAAQINAIYYVVLSLPFVFAMERGKSRDLVLLAAAGAVLLSGKRTAVLIFIVAYLLVWLTSRKDRVSVKGLLLWRLSLASLATLFLVQGFDLSRFTGRTERLGSGGDSGRSSFYRTILDSLSTADPTNFVLGHGHSGTARELGGSSAHNDYLELWYDYGIVAALFLLALQLLMFRHSIQLLRNGSANGPSTLAASASMLILTMASNVVLIPSYSLLIAVFWGSFALGRVPVESRLETKNVDSV